MNKHLWKEKLIGQRIELVVNSLKELHVCERSGKKCLNKLKQQKKKPQIDCDQ